VGNDGGGEQSLLEPVMAWPAHPRAVGLHDHRVDVVVAIAAILIAMAAPSLPSFCPGGASKV